jgi:hypothetical protein
MVTLVVVVSGENDASVVRRLLPDATERREFVADSPFGEARQVLRAPFPTIETASTFLHLLPTTARRSIEVSLVLDDDECEALARYHADGFLDYEHLITVEGCHSRSDREMRAYHNHRLADLNRVLGQDLMAKIFDSVEKKFKPSPRYVAEQSELLQEFPGSPAHLKSQESGS